MGNDGAGGLAERPARLEGLIRECVSGWDEDATVRSAIRPDGKIDVTIVSARFEGMDSREREETFWPVLGPVPKPEMIFCTYCLLLTPAEAERSFSSPKPVQRADAWDE